MSKIGTEILKKIEDEDTTVEELIERRGDERD